VIPAAFIGASLAWLVVSVAAWYVRGKVRSVRRARSSEKAGGATIFAEAPRLMVRQARRGRFYELPRQAIPRSILTCRILIVPFHELAGCAPDHTTFLQNTSRLRLYHPR
jgi:hypothetical protein